MRNIFFSSLRNSLVTLVLLAVLPALGVILHSSLQNRDRAIKDAQDEALRVVQFLGHEQQLVTMRAELLLALLAQMPQVQNMDGRATTTILHRLRTRSAMFDNIIAADAQGRVFASALPLERAPILKGGAHFDNAMGQNEFTVGEYELGHKGKVQDSLIHYASPIPGPKGQSIGVLTTALRPSRYERLFNVASLPAGSVLTLADKKGTRIYRYPAAEGTSPMGRKLVVELWDVISGEKPLGITTVTQGDGIRRIVAYTQLRLKPDAAPYLYIFVGIPEKEALAEAIASLYRDLMLLGGSAALALFVAWVVGGFVISRPMVRLTKVAQRLGEGDLNARSGSHDEFGELSLLAKTMDDMAEALSEDIMAREAVEDELRKNEALLRMILKALPVGVWMSDPSGRILYANQASRSLLGTEADEAPDPAALKAWRHDSGEPLHPRDFVLAQAIAGKPETANQVLEIESPAEAGRTVITCSAIPIRDGSDGLRAVIVVMADMTEQTQREQARESIEHMMRHDLRSPLIGFISLPQLLLRQPNLTEEQRGWVARLHTMANGMLRILDSYLKLSRLERGHLALESAETDLLDLARNVRDDLEQLPQFKGMHMDITLGGKCPEAGTNLVIACERTLCASMFANLLKNALEASSESDIVQMDFADLGDTVRIAVRNTGDVPPAIRHRFFEKYVTAAKRNGTGLGTYSAKRIAQFHHGEIKLDYSVPGQTTVLIVLPKRQDAGGAP